MEKISIFSIGFLIGAILCCVTIYFAVVRPSEATIADYKAKQRELEATNTGLSDSVRQRELDIGRLTTITESLRGEVERARADYNRLEETNRARQSTIEKTRRLVAGTDDAVRKLELIIDAFEKIERGIDH